ncbi:MAG TPA: Asp-tRNA(Asn)/Glu-tRNA(Gln) amidotransferase subunit GatC [Gemmatimonadaceae bacterium]|nr:Asp-tRNA(Asn)/Glu-tRNA(Gln) amidotransferase subunit GatC [Gemmatimonadaceae bacterium]
MAVSLDDVRHIASLARLEIDDARLPALAGELNAILGHMEALQRVDVSAVPADLAAGLTPMPLRVDGGQQLSLARPREELAPDMRDGFFLVPRLATHEDVDA